MNWKKGYAAREEHSQQSGQKGRLLLAIFVVLVVVMFVPLGVTGGEVHILFDETRLHKRSEGSYTAGEGYSYAIEETASYGASTFANLLQELGYAVDALTAKPITSYALNEVDLLIILNPEYTPIYTTSEIKAIHSFVENGGGLFLAGTGWRGSESPSGGPESIARAFGLSFKDNGQLCDPTDHRGSLTHVIQIKTMRDHRITKNVSGYYGQGTYLDEVDQAFVLAESDPDSWFDRYGSYDWGDKERQTSEENGPFPVLAAMGYGTGRIVISGSTSLVMNSWIDDLDAERLALNIVEWLAYGDANQSPIADFTWELVSGNEVRFDASTSHDPDGHIVSYKWDFNNDGLWDRVSSTPVITHTFPHRLACRTELMVVDDQGQTDTIVRTPYLPAAAPTAKFAWEGLSPEGARLLVNLKTGDRIHFDASASSDPDGQIVKYEWDWDSDGAWDKESTNPVIEHSLVEAGTHQVTLRVTDNNGLTDQSTQAVVIERGDIIQTDFTFRVLNKSLHQIQFDASASIDTMGEIVRYEWDWNNDDSYDTAVEVPTIMNRFPEAGPYQVTLTIVDDKGNRASCTKEVP